MKRIISEKANIACRITYNALFRKYRLQIQVKRWFFWVNTDFWMDVSEGFWGENMGISNVLRLSYECGHRSEAYKSGTLDLDKRANDFLEEYLLDRQRLANDLRRLEQ